MAENVIDNKQIIAHGTKAVEDAVKKSIQSRAHDDANIGLGGIGGIGGLLTYMFRAGELVNPWWSSQRDIDLRRFVKSSDHLSGAVALLTSKVVNVPVHVEPRDFSLKTHVKQADEFTRVLMEESEFGQGWQTLGSKILEDWFTTDNGLFMEVIGDGKKDGPIVGPALGLAALDSTKIVRKKNPEYPIAYIDEDGAQYKLHYTRVAYASDQPSNIVEMRGVGFCLHGNSRVCTPDGRSLTIRNMVRDKYDGLVLSCDEDGKIVPRRVVGWYRNERGTRQMVNVRGVVSQHFGLGKKKNAWVTEDHPILTPDGWRNAGTLVTGDRIVTNLPYPNESQMSLLAAMMLGDGSMSDSVCTIITVNHQDKSEEWLRTKIGALSEFGWKISTHTHSQASLPAPADPHPEPVAPSLNHQPPVEH